jgi:hypothetical protein
MATFGPEDGRQRSCEVRDLSRVAPLYRVGAKPACAQRDRHRLVQADRSPTRMYRMASLAWLRTYQKCGFFHDGRFASLFDVLSHDNTLFNIELSDAQKNDLVEYLKEIQIL